ncbi:hypothetical protein M413DRAFT_13481 [Hebeloma cylindrosporum]|uniref:Uncharacterized protein n=1 Tax=Hebeloma cylindrosporum TaxID=76867 RepID=A0A0C3BKU8_HEBCY|nr:hypothetical protein M413DRAFT_13481 [Hebeloma cylindrosporum h7]
MLSEKLDTTSMFAGIVAPDANKGLTVGRTFHIFDRFTSEEDLQDPEKRDYAASVIAVLHGFGEIHAMEELHGPHDIWFRELAIWLERDPADPINRYKLNSVDEIYRIGLPDVIVLTTPDPLGLPLPDPRYLSIHETCARVVHLSGLGDHIYEG